VLDTDSVLCICGNPISRLNVLCHGSCVIEHEMKIEADKKVLTQENERLKELIKCSGVLYPAILETKQWKELTIKHTEADTNNIRSDK